MTFDFKKEYKELYQPKGSPSIIKVPPINYLAVRGHGDPNSEHGEYKQSIELLYAIAFTLKMSYKTSYQIAGFYEYVVPPLEGFWWQNGQQGAIDYTNKQTFNFISAIRLPEFIAQTDFAWAIKEATNKKRRDFSQVEFLSYEEGLCVQCLHKGSYDNEPATINQMHTYIQQNGYILDIANPRYHHEIYLSDPRRTATENLKTVIRHPIKRAS